jgi:nucleoside-diphosphate-sugar epimerase
MLDMAASPGATATHFAALGAREEELVVVTGANGRIGATLTRTLHEQGHRVRALTFGPARALDDLDVEQVDCDVRSPNQVARGLRDATLVYHLAAVTGLDSELRAFHATNLVGTRNVLSASLAEGVRRVVHFSSVHAMDLARVRGDVDEAHRLVPPSSPLLYARFKAMAEREVQWALGRGLDVVVLAPSSVVGPDDLEPSPVGRALLDLYLGRWPIMLDMGFDWVDVRDVADAAVAAAERAPRGAKYLLSGRWASFGHIARIAEEVTGRPGPRVVLPSWASMPAAYAASTAAWLTKSRPFFQPLHVRYASSPRLAFDSSRAMRELGHAPRPLRDSIADAYRCFDRRGLLL